MSEHLLTDAEMAERIGKSLWFVQSKCRATSPEWPHVRAGKSIRFTAEQVAQIDELLTVVPKRPEPDAAITGDGWGRRGRSAS